MLARLRPWPVTVLAVWTLVLWTGRLGLAWGADGSTASKVWATVPVVLFVVLGVLALGVVLRSGNGVLSARDRTFALGVAVWTIGYWVVRLPIIWFDGRSVGFKLVHTVLAVLSWTASWAAIRSLRTSRSVRGLSVSSMR
jgi:hypothetical protein